MSKLERILAIVWLLSISLAIYNYSLYENSVKDYNELVEKYNGLADDYNNIFHQSEDNCTVVTILYHTNFSGNRQTISLSVPYEKYDAYHKKNHPYWGEHNLTSVTEYITCNETIINQIVEAIVNQTQSREELANAFLDFVQDKGHILSIRYYPTTELKYPIETLVELGGDCDTHSFLYATLMKTAGFKVLVLLSRETLSDGQRHAATAVHLENPPENSTQDYYFTYNEEKYYYAETTNAPWRVGDIPRSFENLTFHLAPL